MRVYAAGARQREGVQTLHVCPGGHLGQKASNPANWFDNAGAARNFTVTFQHGEAEVADDLGRYLIAYKLARKSRLILLEDVVA